MKSNDISPVQIEYDRRSKNRAGAVNYSNRTDNEYKGEHHEYIPCKGCSGRTFGLCSSCIRSVGVTDGAEG